LDVIIAGGGIIGSSIAWRLSQAGLRAAILDAGRLGAEASWAAAGMLAPGGEFEGSSPIHQFALANLRAYPAFVEELQSESGCSIDFQRFGAIEIAGSEAEWQRLAARAEIQAELGISASSMSPEQVRREAPLVNPEIAGAFFYPEDAVVNPREITHALSRACRERGVEIYEGVRVRAIRPETDSVLVMTDAGQFAAGWAVIAAGAWSSMITVEGCELARVFPVRGHLVGYSLEAETVGPIIRRGHSYLLQRAGGFTIAGSSTEDCGFRRDLDRAIITDIENRAAQMLPMLAERTTDTAWLGFRPATEREQPVIGPAAHPLVWLAYGHYRNGILMTPLTAARVASGITASSEMDCFGRSESH